MLELKGSAKSPLEALPGLGEVLSESWQSRRFAAWILAHGEADYVAAPIGRRLKGEPPASLNLLVRRLLAACSPLGDEYPLPHYRRAT